MHRDDPYVVLPKHSCIQYTRSTGPCRSHLTTPSNIYVLHNTLYIACKATSHGAPLLELSSYVVYPCSEYMKFVVDVDLATSLVHKSRSTVGKFQKMRRYRQTNKPTKPGSDKLTLTYCTSTPAYPRTNQSPALRAVTMYCKW